ncbi:MAG TPA: type II toxin-antitoxin system RelE/ParE family toxin [Thermoguttaceae bacterium]|nr:type II toxin-antitoxin system RelE/ParE family toxin [Thermoguttaceae bacterium]
MTYTVLILRRARKELAGLADDSYQRVKEAVEALEQDPRPTGCKKLAGRDGWRIRVGDFRIIYEIDDEQNVVIVLHIGHRKDVYR